MCTCDDVISYMYKNCSSLATMMLWIQEVGNNYGSQVYRNVPVMSAFKHVSLKKGTLPSPGAYVSNDFMSPSIFTLFSW